METNLRHRTFYLKVREFLLMWPTFVNSMSKVLNDLAVGEWVVRLGLTGNVANANEIHCLLRNY